jgi:LmbE family N-acetylglucosaminyl deacetylase
MTRVLVIGAHPDDELLGAGGTLVHHVRDGDEVHALVVADGATSRYSDEMVTVLAESAGRAAKTVGFASLRLLGLPDQRLDTLPAVEVNQALESVVDDIRPQLVYTHFPGDVNTDHGIVARAAWVACRPYVAPYLLRFVVFETASSTEWAWPLDDGRFSPNLFVDITDTLDEKLAALESYDSELRPYPHPRSLRALRERAATWGSKVGRPAAEAFQVLREVR